MNWELMGSIATVVVPTVGFGGWVLDMRIRLLIQQNNDVMLQKINGTYVKKEVCEKQHQTERPQTRHHNIIRKAGT